MARIVRAISADGSVFCAAIDSRDIVNEIFRLHQTTPVASAALGRLSTAGSLMGSLLKNESDRLTLRVSGNGPAGVVTVAADYKGNVKCCAGNVNVDLPLNAKGKLDVAGYIGNDGYLGVIRDMGLKEPYATQVPLVSGEIAEDITSYYAVSEQIPTVCALGVLVDTDWSIKAAGGYLIQLIPPVNEAAIDFIEENIKKMQSVTEMQCGGMSAEEIALMALEGLEPEILDSWEAKYFCGCGRERTERILLSLGKTELEKIVAEKDKEDVEICCHFCNKKYLFTSGEIKKLLEINDFK